MDKTRRQITKIARAARKYSAATLRKQGIGTVEHECLHAILKNEGTSQEEIGEQLNVDKAAVTRMIDSLEKKGYAVREKDPRNRRKNRIFSTDKAMDVKLDEAGAESQYYEWLLEDVDPARLDVFLEVLDEIMEKSRAEQKANFVNVRARAAQAAPAPPNELVEYHLARRRAAWQARRQAPPGPPDEG